MLSDYFDYHHIISMMDQKVKKQIDKFFKICEIVLNQYGYKSAVVSSFECTAICGVILGAAERCDLKDYMELIPVEVNNTPHSVIRCNDKILDFTFAQFDEIRKWPINTKRTVKGMEIVGSHQKEDAEAAIIMAEYKEIHREIMDKIVRTYQNLDNDE